MALTPEQVLNKHFQTTQFRRGYEERDVDDFLDEIVAEMRSLIEQRDDYLKQLNDCRASKNQPAVRGGATEKAPEQETAKSADSSGAKASDDARLGALTATIQDAERAATAAADRAAWPRPRPRRPSVPPRSASRRRRPMRPAPRRRRRVRRRPAPHEAQTRLSTPGPRWPTPRRRSRRPGRSSRRPSSPRASRGARRSVPRDEGAGQATGRLPPPRAVGTPPRSSPSLSGSTTSTSPPVSRSGTRSSPRRRRVTRSCSRPARAGTTSSSRPPRPPTPRRCSRPVS